MIMPLADRLKEIRPLTPCMPAETYIKTSMRMARNGEFRSEDGQPIDQKLRQAISGPLSCLTHEARKAIKDADIYVLPLTACLAFCETQGKRKEIFITGGMIDLIASHILSLVLEQSLPEELDRHHVPGIEDVGARHLLTDMLFLLNFRYFRFGEPLPNIRAVFPESALSNYQDSINGGLLFLILHELGHLERGHLEGQYTGPRHYPAVIDEKLSFEQKQEYDADRFAFGSLLPEYQAITTGWQLVAMNFFEQLEEITAHRTDDHPLTINRSFLGHQLLQAEQLRSETGFIRQEVEFQKLSTNFQNAAKRFDAMRGHFLETTRQEALEILWYIDIVLLQQHFDISIQSVSNTPTGNWLDIPLARSDALSGKQN